MVEGEVFSLPATTRRPATPWLPATTRRPATPWLPATTRRTATPWLPATTHRRPGTPRPPLLEVSTFATRGPIRATTVDPMETIRRWESLVEPCPLRLDKAYPARGDLPRSDAACTETTPHRPRLTLAKPQLPPWPPWSAPSLAVLTARRHRRRLTLATAADLTALDFISFYVFYYYRRFIT
jgi:hypothetical protein